MQFELSGVVRLHAYTTLGSASLNQFYAKALADVSIASTGGCAIKINNEHINATHNLEQLFGAMFSERDMANIVRRRNLSTRIDLSRLKKSEEDCLEIRKYCVSHGLGIYSWSFNIGDRSCMPIDANIATNADPISTATIILIVFGM